MRMNSNPVPMWLRFVAAFLIFGGLGLLEYQDAQTEALIAAQSSSQVASK